MCGIVGLVGHFASHDAREIVCRMNDAVIHRGPDDAGCFAQDGFAFAMRRLSIIDLAGGHQPMWDAADRFGVVFNGEIYNYREVRDRLSGETALRTRSDTEVVLRTLEAKGLDAVHQWNGMFAVAAWDKDAQRLWLLRDRMGVKPLYYYWDGKTFLFASEIKALLASGLIERRLNVQAVWDYLTFRYVPGPETVWQGIRKLPPGTALELERGRPPRLIQYWKTEAICRNGSNGSYAPVRADREFAELFLEAVQLRLVASDVPVGVLLSGGLDSSAVAAAAVELGHRRFHTFSIGFDEPDYSELPYARQLADHIGARHHEIVIGRREFLDALPAVVQSADEPLADLASVPLLAVCRLARQHVKVVLSGEGSDEILAGYDLDEAVRKWETVRALQRIPQPLRQIGASWAQLVLPGRFASAAARIAESPLGDWNRVDLLHPTWVMEQDEKEILWPDGGGAPSTRILQQYYAETSAVDPLQQVLSIWQKSWLVEDLLMKADKMSMATSLELRTPFLDYRLVAWANRQPNAVKVRRVSPLRFETKSVLRRFCADRVPAGILTRPKRGFPVPATRWLRQGLDAWARDTLLGSASRLKWAMHREAITGLLDHAAAGHEYAARKVWLLIVLQLWLEVWDAQLAEKAAYPGAHPN